MRSKREDLILHFTTGPLEVGTIDVFRDGRFETVWVAKVGERIIATVGEEYRFSTAAEAREYGELVRGKMRSSLAEGREP